MRIRIVVDRAAPRRWHIRMQTRLQRLLPHARIELLGAEGAQSFPRVVDLLLTLERMLRRRGRPTLCDVIELKPYGGDGPCDVLIDLTGAAKSFPASRVLRPLYEGEVNETAAAAMLVAGASPVLALEDENGVLVSAALPSLEGADGLTGGLEAVASRVIALVEQALISPRRACVPEPVAPRRLASRDFVAFHLKSLALSAARQIYHLCCYSPHWRIGWRYNDGPGVLERGTLAGPAWRAAPDLGASFSADPFPIEWRGRTYVFFEKLDHRDGKGEIWAQCFGPQGPVGAPRLALSEPWHLSYPFLIEHSGELYMLPEASLSGAVTLYRCLEFPTKWVAEKRLLEEIEAADATIFRHDGRFWMTSVVRDGIGGYSDMLAIHHAAELFGPWEEHAQRPVLIDQRFARPVGAVVKVGAALLRPVQDCSAGYGRRLKIMRIDGLDRENFKQTEVAALAPNSLWPGDRLHTLNRWGRLECIDGAVLTPKSMALRRLTEAWSTPQVDVPDLCGVPAE